MVAVVNNALKCFTDMQSQLMLGNGLKVGISTLTLFAIDVFNELYPCLRGTH